MSFSIRAGRPDDLESIEAWTRDTFEWGDYIPERYGEWLANPESEVLVCAGDDDVPLAVAHVTMASPYEGWMEGARVHPDHRRAGMGSSMNDAGVAWARRRGARVVRLAIETDNPPAQRQVEKLGYRLGSTWMTGFKVVEASFRAAKGARLHPSSSADVDSAWMFWSTSELAAAERGMLCRGWLWRTARPEDLAAAAADARLYQSPYGWVMFRADSEDLETMWLAASPGDWPGLIDGVLDHAAGTAADNLVIKVPALDWAKESLKRAGFRVKGIRIYYKPT